MTLIPAGQRVPDGDSAEELFAGSLQTLKLWPLRRLEEKPLHSRGGQRVFKAFLVDRKVVWLKDVESDAENRGYRRLRALSDWTNHLVPWLECVPTSPGRFLVVTPDHGSPFSSQPVDVLARQLAQLMLRCGSRPEKQEWLPAYELLARRNLHAHLHLDRRPWPTFVDDLLRKFLERLSHLQFAYSTHQHGDLTLSNLRFWADDWGVIDYSTAIDDLPAFIDAARLEISWLTRVVQRRLALVDIQRFYRSLFAGTLPSACPLLMPLAQPWSADPQFIALKIARCIHLFDCSTCPRDRAFLTEVLILHLSAQAGGLCATD